MCNTQRFQHQSGCGGWQIAVHDDRCRVHGLCLRQHFDAQDVDREVSTGDSGTAQAATDAGGQSVSQLNSDAVVVRGLVLLRAVATQLRTP